MTFLATLLFFAVIMAAMAIGVMVSGRRLQGSCGGVGTNCQCSAAEQEACRTKAGQGEAS